MVWSPWCWFDVFIILQGFLEYVLRLGQRKAGGFGAIRALRIFRVIRLARFVRKVRFFRELTRFLLLMGSCTRTLLWSVLLTAFGISIWANIAVVLIHPYVTELADQGEWADCARCPRSFSSVPQASLTLFQTAIAGDHWGQVAGPVIEFQPWTAVVFMGAPFTLVFGVLNLVIAVVVDTSAEVRSKAKSPGTVDDESRDKAVLRMMFEDLDLDGNGRLSYEELRAGSQNVAEFGQWLRKYEFDYTDVYHLFQVNHGINCREMAPDQFVHAMRRMKDEGTKTTARFAKYVAAQLEMHQAILEEKLETRVGEVKTKVDGYQSSIRKGLSQRAALQSDEAALEQRLEEQLESMEATLQQATREALEIALRTAADTTRHLLQAANMARQKQQQAEVEQAQALAAESAEESHCEDLKATAGPSTVEAADAPVERHGFWPLAWWAEKFSPRVIRLPSEDSRVERPPAKEDMPAEATKARRGTKKSKEEVPEDANPEPAGPVGEEDLTADEPTEPAGGDDLHEPRQEDVPPGEASDPTYDEALQLPCKDLQGPRGALSGPLPPFLPGGFQPRAPRAPPPRAARP
mmetsp:Transcript_94489/g.291305  ORF Transcript_94489/g.291305 Transcript_94489/m.291305 type:complete len:578 (+) Transcript_94489:1-1734(+)